MERLSLTAFLKEGLGFLVGLMLSMSQLCGNTVKKVHVTLDNIYA